MKYKYEILSEYEMKYTHEIPRVTKITSKGDLQWQHSHNCFSNFATNVTKLQGCVNRMTYAHLCTPACFTC